MYINEFLDDINNKEHYLYMDRQDKIEMAEKLGVELRILRKDRDLGLSEFANLLHVSKAHISSIESNKRVPSSKLLIRIAEFLNIPHDHFLLLDEFRFIASTINKDNSINNLVNLCVDLIELPRNNAITLALNALLKNAIKKWEGSYVPQLVSSKKASYEIEEHRLIFENEHEEHGLIFDRILPFGMVLNVIDFYKLYSKQELFTVLKLFAQFVIITEEEYELIKRYNLTRKFPVEWLENGILCRYTYVGIDIDRDDYI